MIWSMAMIIFFIYTAVVAPFKIAFLTELPFLWQLWDWLVDIVIIVDICLTMITAFRNKQDEMVDELGTILWTYFKTWLFFDIMAVFPFEMFMDTEAEGGGGGYSDLFQLLRLPRLYRLVRVARVIKMMKKAKANKYMLKI